MKKTRGAARPYGLGLTKRLDVNMSEEMLTVAAKEAARQGKPTSTWARDLMMVAAGHPKLTSEHEPLPKRGKR